MTESKLDPSFSASIEDFKISWQIFRENWKPFIKNELFAVFLILVLGIIVMISFFINPNFTTQVMMAETWNSFFGIFLISLLSIIAIAIFFLPFAFLSCQFGLAYDIISSGDMFAEFEGSFTYYKRHWWQYSILSLLTPSSGLFFPLAGSTQSVEISQPPVSDFFGGIIGGFILLLLYLIWFIIFINTLPSITALGQNKDGKSKWQKFKLSFSESWRIYKNNKKRLYGTWWLFFVIFNIPTVILSFIWSISKLFSFHSGILMLINFLWFISATIIVMISYPMKALIATRIYNMMQL
ncbi:MAG: hypothetical protein EAX96_10405 [Candidatus Lokiarchaeota archaeon]|nr:hypothetical protein [Candidatus Lokiarchaeota archaeon]